MVDKKIRIEWIDFAKVIGIWLVVFGHILNGGRSIDSIESDIYNVIYSFHMPFFFFISGLLFCTKEMPYGQFVGVKTKTLIIPYFLLNLLCVVLCIPLYLYPSVFPVSNYYDFVPDLCTLVDGEFGSAFSRPSWFLVSLFIVMLISYWVVKLKNYWQLLIAGVGVGLAYLATIYEVPLNLDTIPGGFVFFLLGYMLKDQVLYVTKLSRWKLLFFALMVTTLHVGLALYNGKVTIYHIIGSTGWMYWIVALLGIMSLCLLSLLFQKGLKCLCGQRYEKVQGLVRLVSSCTIVILCIHEIFIDYTMDFFLVNHSFHIPLIVRELILTVVILVVCVPVIMLIRRHCPILIGNRK